jgi:acyl dehydratase
MPIDPDHLLGLQLPETRIALTPRDVMLYALGIGMATDPEDVTQLRFTYEAGLAAVPSISTVYPAMMGLSRVPDTGIDFSRLVHGEQGFRLHRPFPVEGELAGRAHVSRLVDKGEGRGALVYLQGDIFARDSTEPIATITSMNFCRANGGFGGPAKAPPPHPIPDRVADLAWDHTTLPQLALIYRLSGDYNPLHADPAYAARAGFPRPILHGRATFGIAAHALLRLCCGYDASRLVGMHARFTAPVFPGETLRTEIWQEADVTSFRVSVPARQVVALDNGRAEIHP